MAYFRGNIKQWSAKLPSLHPSFVVRLYQMDQQESSGPRDHNAWSLREDTKDKSLTLQHMEIKRR
jgi:hypothetical protein